MGHDDRGGGVGAELLRRRLRSSYAQRPQQRCQPQLRGHHFRGLVFPGPRRPSWPRREDVRPPRWPARLRPGCASRDLLREGYRHQVLTVEAFSSSAAHPTFSQGSEDVLESAIRHPSPGVALRCGRVAGNKIRSAPIPSLCGLASPVSPLPGQAPGG
jgi:hypothetical protein